MARYCLSFFTCLSSFLFFWPILTPTTHFLATRLPLVSSSWPPFHHWVLAFVIHVSLYLVLWFQNNFCWKPFVLEPASESVCNFAHFSHIHPVIFSCPIEGWLQGWATYAVTQDPCIEGPVFGLMICCCLLKILTNFIFEIVFCKWSLMGQWSMNVSRRDRHTILCSPTHI